MCASRGFATRLLLLAGACLLGTAAPIFGQEPDADQEHAPSLDPASAVFLGGRPDKRPELALVLSGGGARGAAHIGVLKVLEELHIVPDLIVGTSMGSIVGGLYAAGYSPDEIEEVLAGVDWGATFVDRIPRQDRSFRRKQDDNQAILIPLKLRFQGLKPYLPSGVLGGQNIESLLRSLTEQATTTRDFDELPVPYRAVAADIETGEAIVLGEGSLADAMRASMSIAGTFPPAEIAGRRLVDGGAVANVPVGIAKELGARRVIVVDISSPLDANMQQKSFLGVMSQLTGMLTTGNRAVDIARVRKGDVLIRPDLHDVTFSDFKKAREAVGYGEESAQQHREQLRAFTAPPERWAAFEERHHRHGRTSIPVAEVRIDNGSWVNDEIVRANLAVPAGVPIDEPKFRDGIAKLYALEYFGKVIDDFETVDGQGVVTIRTPPKPYSRGSLQFGVSFESDFEGDAGYSLTVRHAVLAVNRHAGEWINVAQIGSDAVVSSEFYQPFDAKMRWFVAPAVEYRRQTQAIWINGDPIADFSIQGYGGRVDAGRVFGNWGSAKLEAFRFSGSADTRIGLPIFPGVDVDDGGIAFAFEVDTHDSIAFPTTGSRGGLRADRYLGSFGSDQDGTVVSAALDHAISFGSNTVVLGFEAASDQSDRGKARGSILLGGFLRLSGLGRNELIGTKGGLVRTVYYRDILTLNLGSLSNRVFAGASLEAGNAYGDNDPITWPSLRVGGAIFLGADTVAGPAYLGWGRTEPHRNHFYFVFGRRF